MGTQIGADITKKLQEMLKVQKEQEKAMDDLLKLAKDDKDMKKEVETLQKVLKSTNDAMKKVAKNTKG